MAKSDKPVLRIGKLPNLTPVKITVIFDPEIHKMLEDYANIYRDSYGEAVNPAGLIPSMVKAFLSTDTGFKRARKAIKHD